MTGISTFCQSDDPQRNASRDSACSVVENISLYSQPLCRRVTIVICPVMNLLFRVLYAQKCTSTHHMLAMDALRYLRAEHSEDWCQLFLTEIELFIDGAKAPDKKFKDFRNHVLHVSDNFWGGAVSAAELWYGRLVEQLKAKDWPRAVYCAGGRAGVLTHYVTGPLMPLHTGQTEDEAQVHKFIEWGTAKIYQKLVYTHEAARVLQNWRPPESPASEDWLPLLITEGAKVAHGHYDVLIDHYDPAIGRDKPDEGFDDVSRASISTLLGWSIKAIAYVIDQAIMEAAVEPPKRKITVATVLSGLSTPLFWITRKLADRKDRDIVAAIRDELQATGKVIETLPEDDSIVRAAYAEEVLGVPVQELDRVPVRKAGSKWQPEDAPHVTKIKRQASAPRPPRFYLELDSPVVDAPSIGPKTAGRLHQIEIHTVEQLVDANPDDATDQLDEGWISFEVFNAWQQQSVLMCRVPGLRGHDAQLLVAVGITRPEELRDADADELLARVLEFAVTEDGERIVRSSTPPDIAEVRRWQSFTQNSRTLRAA